MGTCDSVLIDGFSLAIEQAEEFERVIATCEFRELRPHPSWLIELFAGTRSSHLLVSSYYGIRFNPPRKG
ncbi:hypothetical protein FGB62_278g00 [Gracilaria domingensis]|nr:hypothetical protein FGB62_278g00 [Gracilaria domingensis]